MTPPLISRRPHRLPRRRAFVGGFGDGDVAAALLAGDGWRGAVPDGIDEEAEFVGDGGFGREVADAEGVSLAAAAGVADLAIAGEAVAVEERALGALDLAGEVAQDGNAA